MAKITDELLISSQVTDNNILRVHKILSCKKEQAIKTELYTHRSDERPDKHPVVMKMMHAVHEHSVVQAVHAVYPCSCYHLTTTITAGISYGIIASII